MDIYDLNDQLLKKLCKSNKVQSCSKKFNDESRNYEKVNIVENLLNHFRLIDKLKLQLTLRIDKNDERSAAYRKEGNEYFSLKSRNYIKALELYNKSICFSSPASENIAIGYANRSAVLFEWKRYKECLENIKLARNANYPERLLPKLNRRERDCQHFLYNECPKSQQLDFKISFNPHPIVPYIAEGLQMKYSDDQGRHIFTKSDLKPGDLVAVEQPFCSVLLPHMKYMRCANCNNENYFLLIPCKRCTMVMFCSNTCRKEAQDSFHKYECPIIDFLSTFFNKIHRTALRVCLLVLSLFSSIDECIAFCKDPQNQNQTCFELDFNNFSSREHYKAIHGLVTNQEKRSTSDLFQRAVVAAVLKRFLIDFTPLKNILVDKECEHFFSELLFKHLQTSPSNMHSIDLIDQKNIIKDDQQCFASAAYAFHSLLNHSCAPNTVRINKGTTACLFVLRPIAAGEILYDNYGYHYATQPKEVRQHNLQMQYHFICKCEACVSDYPLYTSTSHKEEDKHIDEGIQSKDIDALMAYDKLYAADNYRRYCEILRTFSSLYPCSQISSTEECLKMALNILSDSIPNNFIKAIK